jgi:AraC-like DNA-binding protein
VAPPVLHLPAETAGADSPVQVTVRLLTAELDGRAAGSRAVVDRLIDALFVQVVRAWLQRDERDANAGASWLRALRDPDIAGVLALLHDQPARPWTIGELARGTNMSRATLARRFTDRVGEPPMAYLTRWRMDLAAQRLRDTADAVAVIAKSVGYTSEHAFSRAFTRARGQPPGRYRAQVADS